MSRVLHIIDGIKLNSARWSLKMELEVYGKIDAAHMGDRNNPNSTPPWVKFNTREGAERAMEAMQQGKVFVNGYKLKAEYRKDGLAAPPSGDNTTRTDLDLTSRDLFMATARSRAATGGGGGKRTRKSSSSSSSSKSRRGRRGRRGDRRRSPTRSRSKSRRKNRSRSRKSRKRARSRVAARVMALEDSKPAVMEYPGAQGHAADTSQDVANGQAPAAGRRLLSVEERLGTCGHTLVPMVLAKSEANLIECDFCGTPGQQMQVMLCCKECEYDICFKCSDRSASQVLS